MSQDPKPKIAEGTPLPGAPGPGGDAEVGVTGMWRPGAAGQRNLSSDERGAPVPTSAWRLMNVLVYVWLALHDAMLAWRLLTAGITLTVTYFADDRNQIFVLWFVVLMLEIVPRSKPISFVLRAVLLGGKALLHTFGMMLVLLYAFAIIGFIFFPNLFQLRKPEVVDGSTQQPWQNSRRTPCTTVWKCMVVILDQGLRKGDVGEAMDKVPWPVQTWEGVCDECPWDQVGVTCPMQKTCLPGNGNLLSWPQSKLWIRIVYTFFFFVVISAVVIQVLKHPTRIPKCAQHLTIHTLRPTPYILHPEPLESQTRNHELTPICWVR
jgi:hypothetical protein